MNILFFCFFSNIYVYRMIAADMVIRLHSVGREIARNITVLDVNDRKISRVNDGGVVMCVLPKNIENKMLLRSICPVTNSFQFISFNWHTDAFALSRIAFKCDSNYIASRSMIFHDIGLLEIKFLCPQSPNRT